MLNKHKIVSRMQDNDKELLILSLVEYICKKESKPNYVINKIYDLLVNKKLVSRDLIEKSKQDDRINFVKSMLDEISLPKSLNEIQTDVVSFDNNNDSSKITKYINKLYSKAIKNSNADSVNLLLQNNFQYFQNFNKISLLGTGGFGSVYKAYSILDHATYAIKKIVIDTRYKKLNYYLSEVEILAKTHHENIIRYYSTWLEFKYLTLRELNANYYSDEFTDSEEENITEEENSTSSTNKMIPYFSNDNLILTPILYIQMELCTTTLKQYLINRNEHAKYDKMSFEINSIMRQLVNAVKYLNNQGIIHQDITTQNIFIKYDNNNNIIIKLGDFGLSKLSCEKSSHKQTEDKMIELFDSKNSFSNSSKSFANSFYLAPELTKSTNHRSHKVDIYSLGIIYYELLNKFNTVMERAMELKKLSDWILSRLDYYYELNLSNNNISSIIEHTDTIRAREACNGNTNSIARFDLDILLLLESLLFDTNIHDFDIKVIISMLHPDPNKRIDINTLCSKFNQNINLS